MKKKPDWVMRAVDGTAVALGGGLLALYLTSDRVAWFLIGAAGGGLAMRVAHRKADEAAVKTSVGLRN